MSQPKEGNLTCKLIRKADSLGFRHGDLNDFFSHFSQGMNMATETRETRAMPFLRTELQRPLRTHLGHLIHCPELSRSTESSCAAQKIISSQQKGPNTSKSDKVMRRAESRSPEKWPKGLSTLSLDKRRLGENERVSTMPCFSSTHRTKCGRHRQYFSLDLERTFVKS